MLRTFRLVKTEDLDRIMEIEEGSFTKEEAASRQAMAERIDVISDSFLVATKGIKILGYVVGPVISSRCLTDDLFEKTVENPTTGGVQSILSLAVAPEYRGQGIATDLLEALKKECLKRKREGITLTCLESLIPYYKQRGYQVQGISNSVHAGEVWYDMYLALS
ncbi:hypothetical protein IGI37_001162 [Enterococcus sp. AZ194]|uniref:GNAT family N-acetyltransferase n=1 Tax=Enterococcus sp. AZ194 TaxID=2774629 RepID=UPI003F242A62